MTSKLWSYEVETSLCATASVQVGDGTPEVVRIKANRIWYTEGGGVRIFVGDGKLSILKDKPLFWFHHSEFDFQQLRWGWWTPNWHVWL